MLRSQDLMSRTDPLLRHRHHECVLAPLPSPHTQQTPPLLRLLLNIISPNLVPTHPLVFTAVP